MDEASIKRFLKASFTMSDISERGWFRTWFWYLIDSKERKRSLLDDYIKRQIGLMPKDLVEISMKLTIDFPNPDTRIVEILKFVRKNFNYILDIDLYGTPEKWADIDQAWKRKLGDCENMNTVVYCMAIFSGIDPMQIWNVVDLSKLGHYWCMYYSFKKDKWYSIDSTYYPNSRPLSLRKNYGKEKHYTEKANIDFMFNEQGVFKRH